LPLPVAISLKLLGAGRLVTNPPCVELGRRRGGDLTNLLPLRRCSHPGQVTYALDRLEYRTTWNLRVVDELLANRGIKGSRAWPYLRSVQHPATSDATLNAPHLP